ncbi:MAG: hypothetical protein K9H64_13940 [Bacteroidales bacterium]|nr:hypothetical protein [Bacteroidales bacterium]MCF8456713.1 hypothetical protein [Bacteroidales bacterium]
MKKSFLIFVSTIIVLSLSAQNEELTGTQKICQKLVLDAGAAPFSQSIDDDRQMFTYNFGFGYQVFKKMDVRLCIDLFDLHQANYYSDPVPYSVSIDAYHRLWGMALGVNYKAFKGKKGTFLENAGVSFLGKFGTAITVKYSEQESWYYDFSTRIYLGDVPYIGAGMNHHSELLLGMDSGFTSLYLAFGLDF